MLNNDVRRNEVIGFLLLVSTLIVAATAARADSPQFYLFLRNHHIYVRVPDGPEYAVEVNSPAYEEYASLHSVGCVTAPTAIENPRPKVFYKPARGSFSGIVRVELLIGPNGRVAAAQALQSEDSLLLYSVLYAARQWTFEPGRTADGQPTFCRYPVAYDFMIEIS